MREELYTYAEVADLLGRDVATVKELATSGKLTASFNKERNKFLISDTAIDAYLMSRDKMITRFKQGKKVARA